MDENIKLLQPSRKKFTKVPKNKDMQFLTSRFRWLSGTFKILTFSLSESTTSLSQNRAAVYGLVYGHLATREVDSPPTNDSQIIDIV